MTLDGHKVINSTIVHIISAESRNVSDTTTSITTHKIASEFNVSIDIVIDSIQESFTTGSYIKLKNIIEDNAQDTLNIRNCWKIHYIKSNDNIDLIEQKHNSKIGS